MNFDYVAPFYCWLEWGAFGTALQRRRTALLESLPICRKVLLLGEGDGRHLVRFLKRFPDAEVHVVEKSRQMIRLARQRMRRHGLGQCNVRFFHRDVLRDGLPADSYDLISTHFVLDMLTKQELLWLLALIRRNAPNCLWVISEFQPLARPAAAHVASRLALWVMYRFFVLTAKSRIRSLQDHRRAFSTAGLALQRQEAAWGGFLVSELWGPEART